jgi:Flp pilus assembly protein TadG
MQKMRRLIEDRTGNFGIFFALVALPLLLAVGACFDYLFALNERNQIQGSADAAVLAVSSSYTSSMSGEDIKEIITAYFASNATSGASLDGDPELSADNSEICIHAKSSVQTSFMKIAHVNSVPVRVKSCATLPDLTKLEISLVLDVSSSMIEQDRFVPMQEAVKDFISSFANNRNLASRTAIAIVPFSSRVSIGVEHTDWLRAYEGKSAIPDRWTNPKAYHTSSSFKFTTWIDGKTTDAYTSSNHYWMGCIEPRSDLEIKDTGAVSKYGLTDDPPGLNSTVVVNNATVAVSSSFVPMDSNSGSSKSFCPPPITPLTSDFTYLTSAITTMTSQGSTRLDAGMIAGWYTLSPNWRGYWDKGSLPANYANSVRKILVFMTDGMMNTQYGKSSGKLDWACYYSQSTTTSTVCNNATVSDMLSTCSLIKNKGIEIYTIAYSSDADTTNIKKCATNTDYFFVASEDSGSQAYIPTIYDQIAESIRGSTARLTQ